MADRGQAPWAKLTGVGRSRRAPSDPVPDHLQHDRAPARLGRVHLRDLDGQGDEVLFWVGGMECVADLVQLGPAGGVDWVGGGERFDYNLKV